MKLLHIALGAVLCLWAASAQANPAAADAWPMLLFTEPMGQNCF